jgi:hypothetical protein
MFEEREGWVPKVGALGDERNPNINVGYNKE